MTAVIVQCRISSSRLPGKALMELGGKPTLAWTLASMKKVNADAYYVATDEESYEKLFPLVTSCGWQIFKGPLEDVLERFCLLIKKIGADVVVRATADNPFLFYESANDLLLEYEKRNAGHSASGSTFANANHSASGGACDYITYTGLPHGSGIEIFNAHSLLRAASLTDSSYDHEHVGPSLYNHPENFVSEFIPAPEKYFFPKCRTTIDTERDFHRAQQMAFLIAKAGAENDFSENGKDLFEYAPFTTKQITDALELPQISNSILLVPSVKKGQGTGHLRRCLKAATKIGATVYIPENAGLAETKALVDDAKKNGLFDWQITCHFPNKDEYALVVADCFSLEKDEAEKLSEVAVLAALDEGSDFSVYADYLLDIIPGVTEEKRHANFTATNFIELPKNHRLEKKQELKNVLVCFGGEDPAGFTFPVAENFSNAGFSVTAILPNNVKTTEAHNSSITFSGPISNLAEELYKYDVVATHYGLTAYEAKAAGCIVITFATTDLHKRLSEKYGFICMSPNEITHEKINSAASKCDTSASKQNSAASKCNTTASEPNSAASKHNTTACEPNHSPSDLSDFLEKLSFGRRMNCPICGDKVASVNQIIARTPNRTFRRCSACGLIYMSWTEDASQRKYSASYFADEYKAQYGKTYIEDFDSIKTQCVRRMENIAAVANSSAIANAQALSVLDIGCAYGAFLAAAKEKNWDVYGTDISEDAVAYVKDTLKFSAVTAQFPDFDSEKLLNRKQFDCVTMWYVIEHFSNLSAVLEKVSALVKSGGIFAFSTPSGEGVSAKYNRQNFFTQSPADHYTIWEPSRAADILKKFGFVVEKIVSTGHHAERFPEVKKNNYNSASDEFKSWIEFSIKNNLGDTCEIYCRKIMSD